jgi:hypothetical protein
MHLVGYFHSPLFLRKCEFASVLRMRNMARSGHTRSLGKQAVCILYSVDQEWKFEALDILFCMSTAALQSSVYEKNVYCSAVGRNCRES